MVKFPASPKAKDDDDNDAPSITRNCVVSSVTLPTFPEAKEVVAILALSVAVLPAISIKSALTFNNPPSPSPKVEEVIPALFNRSSEVDKLMFPPFPSAKVVAIILLLDNWIESETLMSISPPEASLNEFVLILAPS